jgi:hypothetical protein
MILIPSVYYLVQNVSNWRPGNSERMSFSVEHELILAVMIRLPNTILFTVHISIYFVIPDLGTSSPRMPCPRIQKRSETYGRLDQITIFHHLRKQEAVLKVIVPSPTWSINIPQLRKSTSHSARSINSYKRIPRPVAIRLIACGPIRVVETLDDFRPEDILSIGDVETCFGVERGLGRGRRGIVAVCSGGGVGDPAEGFGPDAGEGASVGIVAAGDEGEAEVNVFLLLEDEAAEEEGSSVKASDYFKH